MEKKKKTKNLTKKKKKKKKKERKKVLHHKCVHDITASKCLTLCVLITYTMCANNLLKRKKAQRET